jgi:GTP-binding protein Era
MNSANGIKAKESLFTNIRDVGSPELLGFLDQCASFFPEDIRFRLREMMKAIPDQGDTLNRVLGLVARQWEGLRSQKWLNIALVGPASAGKGTLLHTIRGGYPEAEHPIFSVVDTQGLEEFLGYRRWDGIPEELQKADIVLLILDASFELSEATLEMSERLASLGKPYLAVLNKADLVDRPRRVAAEAGRKLGVQVFPFSASRIDSVNRLLKVIVTMHPKALFPLARNLPGFRRSVCDSIITQAAVSSGVVGAIPIPISDLLPISAIQTAMVLKIARIFGFSINRVRARELLPVLAAGMLVREGGIHLKEKFPRHQTLISVSLAGSWTWVVGKAAVLYFERLSRVVDDPGSVLDAVSTEEW